MRSPLRKADHSTPRRNPPFSSSLVSFRAALVAPLFRVRDAHLLACTHARIKHTMRQNMLCTAGMLFERLSASLCVVPAHMHGTFELACGQMDSLMQVESRCDP